jgi:hypothetical protein
VNHSELVRDFHQLTVDAYAARHAPREVGGDVGPISVAYALVGLHLALDRGVSGIEVRAAHQRMGKPDQSWPPLHAPERTRAMTVFDVAEADARADGLSASSVTVSTMAGRCQTKSKPLWTAKAAAAATAPAQVASAGPVGRAPQQMADRGQDEQADRPLHRGVAGALSE